MQMLSTWIIARSVLTRHICICQQTSVQRSAAYHGSVGTVRSLIIIIIYKQFKAQLKHKNNVPVWYKWHYVRQVNIQHQHCFQHSQFDKLCNVGDTNLGLAFEQLILRPDDRSEHAVISRRRTNKHSRNDEKNGWWLTIHSDVNVLFRTQLFELFCRLEDRDVVDASPGGWRVTTGTSVSTDASLSLREVRDRSNDR